MMGTKEEAITKQTATKINRVDIASECQNNLQ
jgi:hypothetical protein